MNAGTDNNPGTPWVSFCMTTYKRPEFLKKQLESLTKQTFSDFHVIISDNDVEASAKAVVEAFNDPRFFYSTNEQNLGMVKSFNRSLARARSEYVVMITDDDPVYPDMLQTLHDLSKEYPGYGMYYGGCDILCMNPIVAKSSRLRVGTNSCLADLPIGTIRTFTGQEFPYAYFENKIGGHILWSTGIVRREIALKIGGMPDFGAPYNTDFGFIVLSGAQEGALLLNTSLGCQVVHGANYGFTEADFEKFYITPQAFCQWIMDRLPAQHDFSTLKRPLELFTARWVVEYAVSVRKFLKDKKLPESDFKKVANKIFHIPFLRKWRLKYQLAVNYPRLFEMLIAIKLRLGKQ